MRKTLVGILEKCKAENTSVCIRTYSGGGLCGHVRTITQDHWVEILARDEDPYYSEDWFYIPRIESIQVIRPERKKISEEKR